MGPTLSFETFPRTHGPLIYTGLEIEICFFFGAFDLPTATHNAVFVSMYHNGRASEALYLASLPSVLSPVVTL
jgi:hypothetical protein